MSILTEAEQQYLAELEEEFKYRYTDKDEEFMKYKVAEPSKPPIVFFDEPYISTPRQRGMRLEQQLSVSDDVSKQAQKIDYVPLSGPPAEHNVSEQIFHAEDLPRQEIQDADAPEQAQLFEDADIPQQELVQEHVQPEDPAVEDLPQDDFENAVQAAAATHEWDIPVMMAILNFLKVNRNDLWVSRKWTRTLPLLQRSSIHLEGKELWWLSYTLNLICRVANELW